MVTVAIISSLAQKAEDLVADIGKACFDRMSRENKCSYGIPAITAGRVCT